MLLEQNHSINSNHSLAQLVVQTPPLVGAEVLGFTSGFLKAAIKNFGEISIIKSCLKDIAPLLKKFNFLENAEDMNDQSRVKQTLLTSLKISLYLIAMVSAKVVDNANKTALVMYTAGKIDQFVPTFLLQKW